MPESPEVQALAEFLDARLSGRTVQDADLVEFRALKTRARPLSTVVGARIEGVRRIGKHVDVRFAEAHLVVSLGRHGWVRFGDEPAVEPAVAADDQPDAAPALAVITLDDGAVFETTDAGGWVSLGLSVVDDSGRGSGDRQARPRSR